MERERDGAMQKGGEEGRGRRTAARGPVFLKAFSLFRRCISLGPLEQIEALSIWTIQVHQQDFYTSSPS